MVRVTGSRMHVHRVVIPMHGTETEARLQGTSGQAGGQGGGWAGACLFLTHKVNCDRRSCVPGHSSDWWDSHH